VGRTQKGRTSVRRVELTNEQLKAASANDWPLSRLWVMGQLGGMPDV